MAAGQGFKTFTTGEVLTAADVNGYLMQGVLVFASAAARNAAITSPQEGQFAFTKDTNGLWYYDGAAWVASGATGDIEGVTAGVGISGGGTSGTVTITNDMATTITASGDIVVGTGSGTYDNLPIGTTGQLLTADTTVSPYKVKWATAPSADKTWTSIANGNIATGVSTTTITGLGGYDDVIILLYNRVTSADNKTYELTMNNTTTYYGSYFRSDAYATGNDSAGTGSGFRLSSVNYAGTAVSNDYIHIRGCKSTGMKTFEYIYASGYMTQHYIVEGYTNSTAALSSFTITSNGTLNGGTYRILGA
jgi:hypothetical protein